MSIIDEKQSAAIQALNNFIAGPGANDIAIPENKLKNIFADAVGPAFAGAMLEKFVESDLLQPVDSEDEEDHKTYYEATVAFFEITSNL